MDSPADVEEEQEDVFEEAEDELRVIEETVETANPFSDDESDDMTGVEDEAALRRSRAIIEVLAWTVSDDLTALDVEKTEKTFLLKRLDQAEDIKAKMRDAAMEILQHDPEGFHARDREMVEDIRKELTEFTVKAQARMVIMNTEARADINVPRNMTEKAQAASREIKAQSVASFHTSAVEEMTAITNLLKGLKFSSAEDQAAFRREEQTEKALTKRMEVARADAQRLRNDAVDAGMAQAAEKLETGLREMNIQCKDTTDLLLVQRRERNLLSVGSAGSVMRGADISPPVFSGKANDQLDYYKFTKELEEYEKVKMPSTEELVRILLTKCLQGEARMACEHMSTREEIFAHLKKTYGDVRIMINQVMGKVKALGSCSGSETQMRSWMMAVKNQLNYAKTLAVKHGGSLEHELYHSKIALEVQNKLPPKHLEDFLIILEAADQIKELTPEAVFNHLLDYLTKIEGRLSYRLKLNTRLNEVEIIGERQVPAAEVERRRQNNGGNRQTQQPRRTYAVNPGSGGGADVFISTKLENCKLCNDRHTYLFYCPVFQQASFEERYDLARKAGNCFRCLITTTTVDFTDRRAWFEQHKQACETEWFCPQGKCGTREKSRQMSFLLCSWHAKKNIEVEAKFIQSLNKSEMKQGAVKFLFNAPIFMNWSYGVGAAKPIQGWKVLPDVSEPSIFMLAYVQIDEQKLLVFFDSGCGTASISQRVKELLNTEKMSDGPSVISVAGGKTIPIPGGEERFSMPLADGKTRCTITALCMPEITSPFPTWNTETAVSDIVKSYRGHYPEGPELPTVPPTIGGCAVDIMLGVQYLRWFPQIVYMADCGLSIYQSPFLAPGGHCGVLAGPHRSWRMMNDSAHSIMRIYAHVPTAEDLVQHVPEVEEVLDDVDVHGDVIGPDGIEHLEEESDICAGDHCKVHTGQDWNLHSGLLTDWAVNTASYTTTPKERMDRFVEGESMGDTVDYRCPACRHCANCKQSDRLESISLQEEKEQYMIQESVKYDRERMKLVATLPFITDPTLNLKPNYGVARKVFQSQMRKASRDENVRLGIVASHKKLADKGFVCRVKDLPPGIREKVENSVGYVIPWRTVTKATSISTPVRMVFDASSRTPGGDSLNGTLAKGQNTLGDLYSILLRFRMKKVGMTADVSMAYNGIMMDPDFIIFQKFLWANGMRECDPVELWVVLSLIYGVKPAGNQTTEGFHKLGAEAKANPAVEAELGAQALLESAYMDDVVDGADTKALCSQKASELKLVLSLGQMAVKDVTFSGTSPSELVSTDGVHLGLLGYLWDSKKDWIMADIGALYLGKISKHKSPILIEESELKRKLGDVFTRRTLVSKVASIFDPLGLLVPVTAKYKLHLAEICNLGLDWDDVIPENFLDTWCKNIEEIQTLGQVNFPRTVIPEDAANLNLSYVISCDASSEIAIAVVHSRVQRLNGSFHVQVLTAKSKIVRKLTVPRAELRGAVLAATLAHTVVRNTGDRIGDVVMVTDSSICMYWMAQDQRPLQTGVRNAVLEIRRLSNVENWKHVDSNNNVADIGTRSESKIPMSRDSEWVRGKDWMGGTVKDMPLRSVQQITLNSAEKKAAAEEMKAKDISGVVLHSLLNKVGERYSFSNFLVDPNRYPWPKSVRVMAVVLCFIDRVRGKVWSRPWFPTKPIEGSAGKDEYDSDYNVNRAEHYFFYKATQEVKQFSKKSDWQGCETLPNKILYYNTRVLENQQIENQLGEGLDVAPLMFVRPVADRYSPVAYAVMTHAHVTLARHRNVAETLRESRLVMYIFGGRDLAVEIREGCPFCKRYKARLLKREMGKLNSNRFVIAPPFYTSQCDIFGPLEAHCEHNHRSVVKVWGLVFKCPSTGAVGTYCMAKYDTSSFVLAYSRHATRYGHPKQVVIDAGSQLVKGTKEMELSIIDPATLKDVEHQVGVKFILVPVGSHYQNGQVERVIRDIRSLFMQMYAGLRLDILTYETAFNWVSSELNNFPQMLGSKTSNLDNLDLITPARLMYGRNNKRAMSGQVTVDMPTRMMKQMRESEEAWWKVWTDQRLQAYVPMPRKWLDNAGTVGTGDIVLFLKGPKEMAVGEPVWKVGRVVKIREGREGISRDVTVEYRNSTEKTFRKVVIDTRQIAVLHHEGELELVDLLNQAAKHNNLLFINVARAASAKQKN